MMEDVKAIIKAIGAVRAAAGGSPSEAFDAALIALQEELREATTQAIEDATTDAAE